MKKTHRRKSTSEFSEHILSSTWNTASLILEGHCLKTDVATSHCSRGRGEGLEEGQCAMYDLYGEQKRDRKRPTKKEEIKETI